MGFGFNFKDYNDRLKFKKSTLKDVKQTLEEQDFVKAEINKKENKLVKKKKNNRNFGTSKINIKQDRENINN